MRNYASHFVVGLVLLVSVNPAKGDEFSDIRALAGAGHRAEENKDYANARRNYDAAVQLHPKNAVAYAHRGLFFFGRHQYALAVTDFNTALVLRPSESTYAYWRGITYAQLGKYDLALADLNRILGMRPLSDDGRAQLLNERAWIEATCPDARYRNGKQAIEDAKIAVRFAWITKSAYFDTLAAAYAESGDFDSAIKSQEKAIAAQSKTGKLSGADERLANYKQHRPYRDHPDKEG
jgi:tetratricopeptide (TPR) repeat protein